MKTITIDLDDTVFDFYGKILSVFGEPKHSHHYLDMTQTWPEFAICIDHLVSHAPFYSDLRIFQQAPEIINELYKNYRIVLLTARPETVEFHQITDQAVRKAGINFHELYVAGHKKIDLIYKIKPDYHIDDMPKYLNAASSLGATTIKMRTPANKFTGLFGLTVSSWYEIGVYFKNVSKAEN